MRFYFVGTFVILAAACSSYQPQKFEAQVPSPQPSESKDVAVKDVIIVKIQDDEIVFLNGKEIGTIEKTSQLEKEVKALFEIRKKQNKEDATTVYVRAAKMTKYGKLVKVIDILKAIGAEPIGLQIDELSQ